MILGVSGWLGDKLGIKEKVVRLGFVLSVLLFGVGVAAYLILWVVKIVTD
jgi:phage shock protein PspC (stress-responsive transcriptional regulator)